MASRLEAATKQYGVLLLLSGQLVVKLSNEVRELCREIDTVTVKGSRLPLQLYTVDLDISQLAVLPKQLRETNSKEHYNQQRQNLQSNLDKGMHTIKILKSSRSF